MEIKAELFKPYTQEQRIKFIVENNHKLGYVIEETDKALLALGYMDEELVELEKERIGNLKITKRLFAIALRDNFGIPYQKLKQEIAQSDDALLEWDLCVELHRNNPLLDTMAAKMGVTSQQLDYIFRVANGEDVSLQVENEEKSNTNETVLPDNTTKISDEEAITSYDDI